MHPNSVIKFAVLGCGHIGKRHIAVIKNNPECELVAIADTSNASAANMGEYKVPFFDSIDDLLKAELPFDALCIATPSGLHEEHAVKALQAGRHIVIEKPMALTGEGCKKIIASARQQGKQVFCVMQNRYALPLVWLKGILSQKILGKIFMVQLTCFWNRDDRYYTGKTWHGTKEMDGGVLFTQFSHFIDMLLWLFGDIENINSRMANFTHHQLMNFPDSGFVNFDLENGGMGCINFSTSVWKQNFESSITIIAENGTVKIGGQYMNELQVCNIKAYSMPQLAPSGNDNHHFIFENVVDVLKGRASLAIDPEEGLKTVEMIERMYGS